MKIIGATSQANGFYLVSGLRSCPRRKISDLSNTIYNSYVYLTHLLHRLTTPVQR